MSETKKGLTARFKTFLIECRRVLSITKKPNKTEFGTIVKVSGLGITVIGLIGFLIQMGKVIFFS